MKTKQLFFTWALIGSFFVAGQNGEQITFGDQSYEIVKSKPYGSGGEFQKDLLTSKENLLFIIADQVKTNQIETYDQPDPLLFQEDIQSIELEFVTYQGFNACKTVTCEYVSVNINGKSVCLIHQDEFEKVVALFEAGKHQSLFKDFLYETSIKKYVSIQVSW